MARVLLINPPIYDFAAYDLWARPLGLLYVASYLESLGHHVRVTDALDRFHPSVSGVSGRHAPRARRYGTGSYYWREADKPAVYARVPRIYKRFGLPEEAFKRELAAGERPDVIGVTSGMTYWYLGVVEAVRAAREAWPGVPVVLGGIYATLCGEHAREVVRPDVLVRGTGEAAMARAAGDDGVAEVANVANVAFADAPDPAYHLLRRVEAVAVLTGRGCPFRCAYCAAGMLAPGMERRQPEAVVREIEGYRRRFGTADVAFYDDALLWEAEAHIKPILRGIISRDLNMRFHTPNGLHVRMIDAELAGLMRRAGFVTLRLSLETVAPGRQADWDNKVRYEEFLAAAAYLREAGFDAQALGAYILVGLPGETPEEAARNIFAAHSAGVAVRLAEYSPIPGTRYFAEAREKSGVDLSEPLLQNNTALSAGGIGPYGEYEAVKAFAARLNDMLFSGRVVTDRAAAEGIFCEVKARRRREI